ncbi:MAG: hypothetical protein H5T83_10275 [Actinotalea sp.]|nr:hypothetical protein [Actinotalea sp.]
MTPTGAALPPEGRDPRTALRRTLTGLGALVLPVVLGSAVLAAALGLRMVPRDAVVVALAVAGFTLALRMLDKGDEHAWPEPAERDTDGSRRDVAHLSWALVGRDGRVSEAAVRRLREDARRRLARTGVVLPARFPVGADAAGHVDGSGRPDPVAQARARLGEPAWTVLTATGRGLPSLDEVELVIDALERLAPLPAGPPAGTPAGTPTGTGPTAPHRAPDGRTSP